MTLNNAYKIYTVSHERVHQQDKNEIDQLKPLMMDEAVEELTHFSLQGGDGVRKWSPYHPLHNGIYGTIQPPETAPESLTIQRFWLIQYTEKNVCVAGASLCL